MKVLKTILNTLINILIVMVLVVSVVIAVFALSSKASGISSILGYTVQTIQSDSMKGTSPEGYEGGNFEAGDIIIGKASNFDNSAKYEVGDIVTFLSTDSAGETMLIVHRIVDVKDDGSGNLKYQTWGDNREVAQVPDQSDESEYISGSDIAALFYSKEYNGNIIKGLGRALDFIQTQMGFFLVVLLPMIIFFIYELVRVIINATKYKTEKAVEEAEKDKQAAIEAAVAAAMNMQNGAQPAAQPAAPAAPAENKSEAEAAQPAPQPAAPQMTPEELEQFKQFQEFKKMQQAQQEKQETTEQ